MRVNESEINTSTSKTNDANPNDISNGSSQDEIKEELLGVAQANEPDI